MRAQPSIHRLLRPDYLQHTAFQAKFMSGDECAAMLGNPAPHALAGRCIHLRAPLRRRPRRRPLGFKAKVLNIMNNLDARISDLDSMVEELIMAGTDPNAFSLRRSAATCR